MGFDQPAADVQEEMIHSIRGLERAEIMRYGYAVEYDYAPPSQLHPSLERRNWWGVVLAGQINGTTGYEEAAGQGLLAGANVLLGAADAPSYSAEEPGVPGGTD
ncbi:MAG: FAD-dependent oxidoreductase [Planctomycetales bacterium]